MDDLDAAARTALANDDGTGLEQFLRVLGASFVEHRRYATLMLARGSDETATRHVRTQIAALTDNAHRAGTLNPDVTLGDVMSLIWSLRALAETTGELAPARLAASSGDPPDRHARAARVAVAQADHRSPARPTRPAQAEHTPTAPGATAAGSAHGEHGSS